jgi:hypothetical protein
LLENVENIKVVVTGVNSEAGTNYPSRAPKFTLNICGVYVAKSLVLPSV